MKAVLYCVAAAGLVASASAQTLTPLSSFGVNGWRAPSVVLTGDSAGAVSGSTYLALGTGSLERGLAYNPATGNLHLVTRNGGINATASPFRILSGTTAVDIGQLSFGTGVISGGTFAFSTVAASSDGAVYIANLQANTNTGAYKVYRWADSAPATTPTTWFNSTIAATGTTRLGDDLDIIGSGSGTTLVGGFAGAQGYARITGSGASVTQTFSPATPLVGGFRLGITFAGADNAVWGKQTGGSAALSPVSRTLADGTFQGSSVLSSGGEMALDYAVIGGVTYLASLDGNSSIIRIYDMTNPATPVLAASGTTTSGTLTSNGNGTGSIQWGAIDNTNLTGVIYAMSTNQGIQAMTFTVPAPGAAGLLGIAGLVATRRRR